MRPLIKFELKKILWNRTALIVLVGAFLVNLLFFILGVAGQVHYSAHIRTLSGLDAIRYEQALVKPLKGYLTDDFISKVKAEMDAIESDPQNGSIDQAATDEKKAALRYDGATDEEIAQMQPVIKLKDDVYLNEMDQYDFVWSVIGLQERIPGILSELKTGNIYGIYDQRMGNYDPTAPRPAGTNTEISKLLSMYESVERPYYYDYYTGWFEFCTGFSKAAALILGIAVAILLAPVFSQEYSSRMDHLILTARYGKSKLIAAKLISAFVAVISLYALFALINSLLFAAVYGLSGSSSNIQINAYY